MWKSGRIPFMKTAGNPICLLAFWASQLDPFPAHARNPVTHHERYTIGKERRLARREGHDHAEMDVRY
jgi:hypothetical protein